MPADFVYNIAKGAVAEMFRDGAANGIVLLLKAAGTDATQKDFDDLAALIADASVDEADFTNYARKTGLTGTITVDDTNDRVDVDLADQTWSSAGGAANNTLTDLVVAYQNSAADSGRVPLTQHDFAVTTDGSDLTAQFNAAGFYRAS
jgi:hypothetical protein